MKKNLLKILGRIIFLTLLCSIDFSALSVTLPIDGIWYELDQGTHTGSVINDGRINDSYRGDIAIPSEVEYDGYIYIVTSIGTSAFENATGMTSIEIPNSVTSIGEYAFYKCTGLTSIEIPNSVASIDGGAFSKCSNLRNFTVADGEEVLLLDVFAIDSEDISEIYLGREIQLVNDYDSYYGKSFGAFERITHFSVTIGKMVKAIGRKLFYNSKGLVSVKMSDSINKIGIHAFSGCTGLTSIDLPNSINEIDDMAFYRCTGLTSVELPQSLTKIQFKTFYDCTGLTSIEIPDSVTAIESEAFGDCTGLTSVKIGAGVTTMHDGIPTSSYYEPFLGCDNLEKVEYASIESLCKISFSREGCNPLYYAKHLYIDGEEVTDLIIPEGVQSIGAWAFINCTQIVSVKMPESLTYVGKSAFAGCNNIGKVDFASVESPCSIEFATAKSNPLYNNSKLYIAGEEVVELTIPESVTSIGSWAFINCSDLISLEMSNSVTSIGASAFSDCKNLESIRISDSVTTIGDYSFRGCTGLKNVYYGATRPINTPAENIFDNEAYSNATLWVPESSVELYQRVNPWRNFYEIKPYNFTTGVENIVMTPDSEDDFESDKLADSAEIYTLDGIRIYETPKNLAPGVYIILQGNERRKISVK